jgi:hypothetical protein
MIFYVSLMIASFVVASVIVWFYRSVVDSSRRTYKAILPSSRGNLRAAAVGGVAGSRQTAASQPAPWGWKAGKDRNKRSVGVPAYTRSARPGVGWPYRNEPFANDTLGGLQPPSKVARPRKVSKGGIEKPWGW